MADRILRRREVQNRIGLSRSTIYEGIARGEFPKPIKLGKRAVGWPESVIVAWLEGRANDQSPSSSDQRGRKG